MEPRPPPGRGCWGALVILTPFSVISQQLRNMPRVRGSVWMSEFLQQWKEIADECSLHFPVELEVLTLSYTVALPCTCHAPHHCEHTQHSAQSSSSCTQTKA